MKESYLIFANRNPVDVILKKWSTDLKNSEFSLVGCNSGNITEAIMNYSFENLYSCVSKKKFFLVYKQLFRHNDYTSLILK